MAEARLFTVFVVALVSQLRVANLDATTKSKIYGALTDSGYNNKTKDKIMITLEKCGLFKTYKLNNLFISDMEGVVFDFSNKEELVAEITFENDKNHQYCKNVQIAKEAIKSKNINYVNKVLEIEQFSNKYYDEPFFVCVEIYEKSFTKISSGRMFSTVTGETKTSNSNSKQIFRLFGKVIQGIAELNFKGKILHGNINPKNIMVRYQKDKEFDPVIINFSQIINSKKDKKIANKQIRYQEDYRLPEMKEEEVFIQGKDLSTSMWVLDDYKYSADYIEDVYALGKTIKKVVDPENSYFDHQSCEIKALRAISKEMTKDEEYRNLPESSTEKIVRPNMKEMLAKFIAKMKECDPFLTDQLNKEFFEKAEKELEALKKQKILII